MQIVSNRNIRLAGQRIAVGQPTEVAQADGELAIRHGWAVQVAAAPAPEPKPKAKAEAKAKHEAKPEAKPE